MTDSMESAASEFANVPMEWVGPLRLYDGEGTEDLEVPLATYESPLWPSVNRGARVTLHAGGIRTTVMDERMTRSVLFESDHAAESLRIVRELETRMDELHTVVSSTSRFAALLNVHPQFIANQVFLRFEFTTGDASGHNMVTKASDALLAWILEQYPTIRYGSVSGNFCTDKKVSAVNGILGRGKNVIAETMIPTRLVGKFLKSTPEALADINLKKNLLGSLAAGSLRSANAHFANMLLGVYLATGQDAANIVEGSQGITHVEAREEGVYFSVTIPNLIVGTVGNGKGLPFVTDNLRRIGCAEDREPGENARRLARICAAVVLCGELSLLAALTNPGELMAAHLRLERS